MPMLKVREPEKRFSRYTTITFKRPRPRNNFKHSQKILGPLRPLSASSQPRLLRLRPFGSDRIPFVRIQILSGPTRTHQLFIEDCISAIPIPIPIHRARSPIPNHLANSDPIRSGPIDFSLILSHRGKWQSPFSSRGFGLNPTKQKNLTNHIGDITRATPSIHRVEPTALLLPSSSGRSGSGSHTLGVMSLTMWFSSSFLVLGGGRDFLSRMIC